MKVTNKTTISTVSSVDATKASVARKEHRIVAGSLYSGLSYGIPEWVDTLLPDLLNPLTDLASIDILPYLKTINTSSNKYLKSINIYDTADLLASSRLKSYTTSTADASARLHNIEITSIRPSEVLSIAGSVIEASIADGSIAASVSSLSNSISTNSSTVSAHKVYTEASFEKYNVGVNHYKQAVADAELAIAAARDNLIVEINGLQDTVDTQVVEIIRKAEASAEYAESMFEYNTVLDIDGKHYYSGFGIKTSVTTDGAGSLTNPYTSEFWIAADRFRFTLPGGTSRTNPFTIQHEQSSGMAVLSINDSMLLSKGFTTGSIAKNSTPAGFRINARASGTETDPHIYGGSITGSELWGNTITGTRLVMKDENGVQSYINADGTFLLGTKAGNNYISYNGTKLEVKGKIYIGGHYTASNNSQYAELFSNITVTRDNLDGGSSPVVFTSRGLQYNTFYEITPLLNTLASTYLRPDELPSLKYTVWLGDTINLAKERQGSNYNNKKGATIVREMYLPKSGTVRLSFQAGFFAGLVHVAIRNSSQSTTARRIHTYYSKDFGIAKIKKTRYNTSGGPDQIALGTLSGDKVTRLPDYPENWNGSDLDSDMFYHTVSLLVDVKPDDRICIIYESYTLEIADKSAPNDATRVKPYNPVFSKEFCYIRSVGVYTDNINLQTNDPVVTLDRTYKLF